MNKHTPSGYSLFTHCSFDAAKNKLDYYRGYDYMKKFCKGLKSSIVIKGVRTKSIFFVSVY